MEAHYIADEFFLAPDELVRNAGRLRGIPGVLIQGRYDLLCPPAAAYAIHEAWPDLKLQFIEDAGHAISERGVMDAMRAAINELAAGP